MQHQTWLLYNKDVSDMSAYTLAVLAREIHIIIFFKCYWSVRNNIYEVAVFISPVTSNMTFNRKLGKPFWRTWCFPIERNMRGLSQIDLNGLWRFQLKIVLLIKYYFNYFWLVNSFSWTHRIPWFHIPQLGCVYSQCFLHIHYWQYKIDGEQMFGETKTIV